MTPVSQLEAAECWILDRLHKGECLRFLDLLLGLNRAEVIEGTGEEQVALVHRALGRLRMAKKIELRQRDNCWQLKGDER